MIEESKAAFNAGLIEADEAVASLLGVFVGRWSLAETCLMMPLIRATNISQEAATAMLASVNSAEGKILIVRNVVESSLLETEEKLRIKASLNRLSAICPERNSLMHHLWAANADGEIFTIDYRRLSGTADRTRPRPAAAIADLANRATQAAFEICAASGSTWMTAESCALLKVSLSDK